MHLDDASLASTCIFITLTQIFLHDPKSIDLYLQHSPFTTVPCVFSTLYPPAWLLTYPSHHHQSRVNRDGLFKTPIQIEHWKVCINNYGYSYTAIAVSPSLSHCTGLQLKVQSSESDVRIADTTWTWNYINKCKLQQSQMTKNGRESVKFNSERLLWSDNVVAIPYLSHSKPRDCT